MQNRIFSIPDAFIDGYTKLVSDSASTILSLTKHEQFGESINQETSNAIHALANEFQKKLKEYNKLLEIMKRLANDENNKNKVNIVSKGNHNITEPLDSDTEIRLTSSFDEANPQDYTTESFMEEMQKAVIPIAKFLDRHTKMGTHRSIPNNQNPPEQHQIEKTLEDLAQKDDINIKHTFKVKTSVEILNDLQEALQEALSDKKNHKEIMKLIHQFANSFYTTNVDECAQIETNIELLMHRLRNDGILQQASASSSSSVAKPVPATAASASAAQESASSSSSSTTTAAHSRSDRRKSEETKQPKQSTNTQRFPSSSTRSQQDRINALLEEDNPTLISATSSAQHSITVSPIPIPLIQPIQRDTSQRRHQKTDQHVGQSVTPLLPNNTQISLTTQNSTFTASWYQDDDVIDFDIPAELDRAVIYKNILCKKFLDQLATGDEESEVIAGQIENACRNFANKPQNQKNVKRFIQNFAMHYEKTINEIEAENLATEMLTAAQSILYQSDEGMEDIPSTAYIQLAYKMLSAMYPPLDEEDEEEEYSDRTITINSCWSPEYIKAVILCAEKLDITPLGDCLSEYKNYYKENKTAFNILWKTLSDELEEARSFQNDDEEEEEYEDEDDVEISPQDGFDEDEQSLEESVDQLKETLVNQRNALQEAATKYQKSKETQQDLQTLLEKAEEFIEAHKQYIKAAKKAEPDKNPQDIENECITMLAGEINKKQGNTENLYKTIKTLMEQHDKASAPDTKSLLKEKIRILHNAWKLFFKAEHAYRNIKIGDFLSNYKRTREISKGQAQLDELFRRSPSEPIGDFSEYEEGYHFEQPYLDSRGVARAAPAVVKPKSPTTTQSHSSSRASSNPPSPAPMLQVGAHKIDPKQNAAAEKTKYASTAAPQRLYPTRKGPALTPNQQRRLQQAAEAPGLVRITTQKK